MRFLTPLMSLVVIAAPLVQAFAPTYRSAVSIDARQSSAPSSRSFFVNNKRHVLFMGWGPDPVWSDATVATNQAACPSGACVTILMNVPAETAASYTVPGQYVQVRLGDNDEKPLFLAIASPPNTANENAVFEFLIKKTDTNEWMTALTAGAVVQVSQVLGNGYNTDSLDGFQYDFPTQTVLLFAAGSGIAPIKAAAESGILGNGRKARLYYGERTAADLCFVELFSEWEAAGIQVVPVLSQPADDWEGRTGYVQAALAEDGIPIPRNSGALLCGMKGMTEAVKDMLLKAGVFDGRILFNF